jgi:hypothetical protein
MAAPLPADALLILFSISSIAIDLLARKLISAVGGNRSPDDLRTNRLRIVQKVMSLTAWTWLL